MTKAEAKDHKDAESYTDKYQVHIVSTYGYKVVCFDLVRLSKPENDYLDKDL